MAHHYSLAIRQAQRAINNIYSSLGVPRQGKSVYVTSTLNNAFYDTWTHV